MDSIVKRISEDVWKLRSNGNIYFINNEKRIIIDTSDRANRHLVKQFLSKVIEFNKVEIVIFTHLHYDHIGNFDLFKNAEFFASEQAIEDFKRDPVNTVLKEDIAEKFKAIKLNPIPKQVHNLEIIHTPGHTKGSICLWYEKEKILFSGDTLFFNKNIGRVDLPTSIPEKMQESMIKLINYNYKILCPGHDY
ncbi:MBL fold metallo-hydrolase [Candidatus Woesearchaeota archaeon]|nr:MBL fold metallo-hydrolase [Candidatus Woesearchaeota archaeon]